MTESDLSKKLAKRIRDRGGWARKIPGGPTMSGMLDIVGCYRGHFLGVETKLPGKERTLTALQQATIRDMQKGGAVAFMCTSVGQLDRVLDRIDALYA